MPNIKPKEFYAQIRKQEYKPVYLFIGEEVYEQEEAWRCIERKLGIDSLNMEIFYCGEMSVNDLMLAAQTHPFMSDKRLLVIKDSHKLKSADIEVLTQFIKNPLATVCMLFLYPEKIKKDAKNSAFLKAVETVGNVVEFRPLYESELPVWVREKVKEYSKTISEEAVGLLISESGSNQLDLSNEIEKLSLYCAKKTEISTEDVENCSGHTRQLNWNNLAASVESGKTGVSLRIIEKLLSEGEVPLKMLATIYRVARRMLIAKSLLEQKKSSRMMVQQELHLNAFFDKYFFNNLSKFSLERLQKNMNFVLNADIELKSSSKPDQSILEELILTMSSN